MLWNDVSEHNANVDRNWLAKKTKKKYSAANNPDGYLFAERDFLQVLIRLVATFWVTLPFHQAAFGNKYFLGQLPNVKAMVKRNWYQQFYKKVLSAHEISRYQLERVTFHNVS